MTEIIEHQMKRAATSGGVLLGQAPVDVAPIVVELRVALLKVYGNKDMLFETAIPPGAQFIGDRNDITELLGNLLDNACKWSKSRVRVVASVDALGRLAPRVDDRHRGRRARASPRRIARKVLRARRSRGRGDARPWHRPGDGARTVELYGGTMRIDSSALGGARFELKLPGRMGTFPVV